MTYNDWLDFIKKIETSKLTDEFVDFVKKNQISENFKGQVLQKMDEAIFNRLSVTLQNVVAKINYLFEDEYLMDMQLVIFRKEVTVLYKLVRSGIFPQDYVENKSNVIRESTDQIFDILCNKANEIDFTGVLAMTIKGNKIRWDKDELQ